MSDELVENSINFSDTQLFKKAMSNTQFTQKAYLLH